MMSFPMEASVVHLQLLVERTAHLLWALNLQTAEDRWTNIMSDTLEVPTFILFYLGECMM